MNTPLRVVHNFTGYVHDMVTVTTSCHTIYVHNATRYYSLVAKVTKLGYCLRGIAKINDWTFVYNFGRFDDTAKQHKFIKIHFRNTGEL